MWEIATSERLFTFVETTVFTKRVIALGLEEPLRNLQEGLLTNPEAGDLEPGTGGLRKIRMPDPGRGKGKRGGARVHYLWLKHRGRIYFIFVYGKNESARLTAEQKRQLRAIATRIKEQG
jgi:hypothetical protein